MDSKLAYGLVFNPNLLTRSKEVVDMIQVFADKNAFTCQDVILAVLWHSFDSTKSKTQSEKRSGPNILKDSEVHQNKKQKLVSILPSTSQINKKSATVQSKTPVQKTIKFVVKNSNNKTHKNTKSIDENVEVINIDDDDDDDDIVENNVVDICDGIEEVVENSHNVEDAVLEEILDNCEIVEDDVKSTEDEKDKVKTTKTILAENDECSYFDMDCDEIDENDVSIDDNSAISKKDEEKPSVQVEVELVNVVNEDENNALEKTVEAKTSDQVDIKLKNGEDKADETAEQSIEQETLDSIGLQRKSNWAKCDGVKLASETTVVTDQSESQSVGEMSISSHKPSLLSVVRTESNTPTTCSQSLLADTKQAEGDNLPLKNKKRLLDHDKKWHMAPKHNVDQDKYLALPGGVNMDSDNDDSTDVTPSHSSRSHSPPGVGINVTSSKFENYKKEFRQSPVTVDTKSDSAAKCDASVSKDSNEISDSSTGNGDPKPSQKKKLKQSKFAAAKSKFSFLKKSIGLRSNTRSRQTQFQVSKIGRKGFGQKTGENIVDTGRPKRLPTHSKYSIKCGKKTQLQMKKQTKDGSQKSLSSHFTRKSTKDKSNVNSPSAGGSDSEASSSQTCESKSNISSRGKNKLSPKTKQKTTPEKDIETVNSVIDEVEWTTEVNSKQKGTGTKTRNSRSGSGKMSKQKKPHVEVLVMEVDEVKYFDDIIPDMVDADNELAGTSSNTAVPDEGEDSDVIILD